MKVKDLKEFLAVIPDDAEIVMRTENYSIEMLKRFQLGIFKLTDYGNDFYPYEKMTVDRSEAVAVLLIPDDPPPLEPDPDIDFED